MTETEELQKLVQKLRTNREKVPEELLKTKYAKPFRELKQQIKAAGDAIIAKRLSDGMKVVDDEKGKRFIEQMQQALAEQRERGIQKELGRALIKEMDVDKFMELVDGTRTTLWNLWIPYWQTYCCLYATPECFETDGRKPRIYNELTDEFLVDEEKNIWEKHPEWKSEQSTLIMTDACHLLAEALREKENEDGQTKE